MSTIGCKVKIVEPGAIATDFAGRSFNFNNDPTQKEYQELVQTMVAVATELGNNASPASLVAEVIYQAATEYYHNFPLSSMKDWDYHCEVACQRDTSLEIAEAHKAPHSPTSTTPNEGL